jgi:hypothetical protein
MIKTRDSVQDLVERPVATPNEEMVVAVANRLLGGLRGVAFDGRYDDVQRADAFTELAIDNRQDIRYRVSSGNGIDDELGFHVMASPIEVSRRFVRVDCYVRLGRAGGRRQFGL